MELTAPTKDSPLLTVKEVARKLRVDPYTVRTWIKKGALEASVLPSGIYRIKQETLNKMLSSRAATAVI